MNLYKTSFLTAISTIIRIVTGFIITKVISIIAGPSGLALIGQLQNFINMVMLSAGNFLQTAITKYTSEDDIEINKYKTWSASLKILIVSNVLLCPLLYIFSNQISIVVFNTIDFSYLVKIFSFSLPFFVLNTLLLSILNGLKEIKKYVFINIILSIVSLFFTVILCYFWNIKGALISYVINQAVVFIITLYLVRKEAWFKLEYFIYKTDAKEYYKLFKFIFITITSIISSNLSLLIIRDFIVSNLSIHEAGCWQAIWALSQVLLSFVTMTLTTYLLPTLSSLNNKARMDEELKKVLSLTVPFLIVICLFIYSIRGFIIDLLYTKDFYEMKDLFSWQFSAIIFKLISWVFGYVLVAKGMVKMVIITGIFSSVLFIILSVSLLSIYGLIGVVYAYLISAIIDALIMYYIYNFKIELKYEK